jgi:chorismate synthase
MFRESYTVEEWRTLQFAPLWVFTAVAGADRNIDQKEAGALAKELSEWAQFKEPLVQEVLLSVARDLANVMTQYRTDSRDVMAGLKDVADLLDRKAMQEQVKNFKGALLLIGRNIAQASGGGPLGLGDKVSAEEKTALALIMMALRAVQ